VKKPYGSLVGVRPGKLVDQMLSFGFSPREVAHRLSLERDVDPVRAKLLIDVALVQQEVLAPISERSDLVSLYISIPFCPSRCAYCSFPSHSLTQYRRIARQEYCYGLFTELSSVREELFSLGLKVCTCYIGGGTPTTLTAAQLGQLLEAVHSLPLWERGLELTIEAGRPDTLDGEILDALPRESRLSINPQSMHDDTLRLIGRSHTVADIREKYFMGRNKGFSNINMDLIVGLPSENALMVGETLREVLSLSPESITLHMFSPKRASRFGGGEAWEPMSEAEAALSSNTAFELLAVSGYRPYYLYRQRGILAGLENVGWAKEGKECLYNILMISEKQAVIGLGAGASSIFPLSAEAWRRQANPKDAKVYLGRLPTITEARKEVLREWRSRL